MGFTPADGLMMGSRCGSLDPGIPVFTCCATAGYIGGPIWIESSIASRA